MYGIYLEKLGPWILWGSSKFEGIPFAMLKRGHQEQL